MSEVYRMFEKHKAALRSVVRRYLVPGADAEDVLQEAFLRAFAAERKRGVEHPKAFMFQVARNTALGDLRRTEHSPIDGTVDFDAVALSSHATETDASDVLDGRRKLHAFTMAVLELPPRCRKAFLLRRIEGLSYRQIANRMGISVSAAEKHVAMGLLRCHEHLTEKGYEPSEFGRSQTQAARRRDENPRSRDGT
ncbi:MAG: RNA polymerase sigma factor [Thioalkalivibrio sp.]|nr:RNA polymerase sigma factor [Thioalkalivibrio sp.]